MNQEAQPAHRADMKSTGGMPVILQYIWLGLTVILTLTGLASIVDGLIVWADFIAQLIQVYESTLRDPIARFIEAIWPAGWPRIPKTLFDLLVIWSSFFTALRLFWAREGQWLRKARRRISWPLAFILGPFVGTYYALRFGRLINEEIASVESEMRIHETGEETLTPIGLIAVGKRREAAKEFRNQLRVAIRNLGGYYLLVGASFVMLLFINYQIQRAERLTIHQQVGR
jgi:hypothetical protein